MRRLVLLLTLLLLVGCAGPPGPPGAKLPDGWPAEPDSIIFQSHARGGYVPPAWRLAQVPDLTLLADGRVLHRDRVDAGYVVYFVGRIPAEELPGVYQQAARAMSGLSGRYEAGTWTDDATTRFALWRPAGRQSIEVYGFSSTPQEMEQEKAMLERLRALRAAVLEAMEPMREPYVAAEVILVAEEHDPALLPWESEEWPSGLPALPPIPAGEHAASVRITGKEAKAVQLNIPFEAPWLYKQGERHYRVFAVPAIPLMD